MYDYFGLSAQFNDSQLTEEEDELMMSEELIRNFRPPHMEFRVGEVVLTQKMIIGVIVGWNIDMAVSLIILLILSYLYQMPYNKTFKN